MDQIGSIGRARPVLNREQSDHRRWRPSRPLSASTMAKHAKTEREGSGLSPNDQQTNDAQRGPKRPRSRSTTTEYHQHLFRRGCRESAEDCSSTSNNSQMHSSGGHPTQPDECCKCDHPPVDDCRCWARPAGDQASPRWAVHAAVKRSSASAVMAATRACSSAPRVVRWWVPAGSNRSVRVADFE